MRHRSFRPVLIAACLSSLAGQAQELVVDTIKAQQPWAPFALYAFPQIKLLNRPEVAERINKDLVLDLLEVDLDTLHGNVFEQVWGDASGSLPRLSGLSWEVAHVLPNVLTIEVSGESCGAHCDPFSLHYNYDLRSGERLQYPTIFTANGLQAVNGLVGKKWADQLEDEIGSLQEDLDAIGPQADSTTATAARLDLYRNCLAERRSLPPVVGDFAITKDALLVWVARCGGHPDQELDTLGYVAVRLPYGLLHDQLNPAVRSLVE